MDDGTIGSLFAGIEGIERGLEDLGLGPVIWQAESDPAAVAILERERPTVRRYLDVADVDERAARPAIVCGGFPCQDISPAGKGAGIDGERSGLWREFARIVRVLRPDIVFVENSAALLGRGLDRVLGDLAACGFDAEWETFRAADVGAPHLRARCFVLAYADRERVRQLAERHQWDRWRVRTAERGDAQSLDAGADVADADGEGRGRTAGDDVAGTGDSSARHEPAQSGGRGLSIDALADPNRERRAGGTALTGMDGRASEGGRGHAGRNALADAQSERRDPGTRGSRGARGRSVVGDGGEGDMANPDRGGRSARGIELPEGEPVAAGSGDARRLADADRVDGDRREREPGRRSPGRDAARGDGARGEHVADPDGGRRSSERIAEPRRVDGAPGREPERCGHVRYVHRFPPGPDAIAGWNGPQPAVRRSDDGVPGRSHRLRLLGNACVPQQAAHAFATLALRAIR